METKEKLISEIFEISNAIRYIALYDTVELLTRQRNDIDNASSNESDKYEELIVNPTLIKLASQRGNIDCGGLQYFVIRYGNFFVLLTPCKDGHINLGIELDQDPLQFVKPLHKLLEKYDLNLI